MDAVVAIPALNPDERLVQLVDELNAQGFRRFVVVDDGSMESAAPVFHALELRGA